MKETISKAILKMIFKIKMLTKSWEFFINHGLLGTLWFVILFIFKCLQIFLFGIKTDKTDMILETLEIEKKNILDEKMKKEEEDILFYTWKSEWIPSENNDEIKDIFFDYFKRAYEYADKKATENRDNNFKWKTAFLIILVSIPILKILLVFIKTLMPLIGYTGIFFPIVSSLSTALLGDTGNLVGNIGLIILWLILVAVIAKWLDVKKYQETWVRHSNHKHKLETEMLKFIYKLDTYSSGDIREKFMIEIMKIWDENQKVFSDNMNNKEIPMHDMIDYIKELKNK